MNGTVLHRIVIQHLDGARKGDLEAFVQATITVGRAADCDLIFGSEKSTSSHHAVVRQRNDIVELIDTQSTNGTFVNEVRVERAVLNDGDVVRFGVLGPIVKIGLPQTRDVQTERDLPQMRPAMLANGTEATASAAMTEISKMPTLRNWRFVRNTAFLYAGGAIAALGAFNTIVDRYKLDVRWFTTFLLFSAGGFVSTLLEAWYRGTPGSQKFQWWELATHVVMLVSCLGLTWFLWR
jgi:FHA domain